MVDLDTLLSDSVYSTDLPIAATYVDDSDVETSINVIPQRGQVAQPGEIQVGVLDERVVYSMQKSALAHDPVRGHRLMVGGVRHAIDAFQPGPLSTEWTLYVYEDPE